jgi:hypothetical protein
MDDFEVEAGPLRKSAKCSDGPVPKDGSESSRKALIGSSSIRIDAVA